ncbi:MAG: bifunctional diaminohydroxyphosphoribosylaminopyrimidine deaminase/5-amino-6-(5-phosphoribosylamino)uracil reductase RibD [Leucobacter sp.]
MPDPYELSPEVIESAMRRAIRLAQQGPQHDPNPQVGCVILGPNSELIAEGWHEGAGTPHAEIAALTRVPPDRLERARELTVVVTLEPCNHVGRTGPCAQQLVDAGVGSVVYAFKDPGNSSAGGAQTLREGGVRVIGGVLETDVRQLLASWLAEQAGHTHD